MGRLPQSLALLSCAFMLACGEVPEREYGAVLGSSSAADDDARAPDDDSGEAGSSGPSEPGPPQNSGTTGTDDGAPADDGGDDTLEFSPAFPLPRMSCPAAPCIEGGEGGGKTLLGRDVVREAFFSVAGFPDAVTYATHTDPEGAAPPLSGLVGAAVTAVLVVDSLVAEAGIASCDDLPEVGTAKLASVPGVSLRFEPGRNAPPADHANAGVTFEKRVTMTDASGASAVLETTCDRAQGYAALNLLEAPGSFGRINIVWDHTSEASQHIELIAHSKARGERVAMRFATQSEEVRFWLVRTRVGGSPLLDAGLRVYAHGDSIDHRATAFAHAIPERTELYRDDAAASDDLAPLAGTLLQCADFVAEDALAGAGGACLGLDVAAPSPPAFDPEGAWSIAWVALPAGQGGMLDAFELPSG